MAAFPALEHLQTCHAYISQFVLKYNQASARPPPLRGGGLDKFRGGGAQIDMCVNSNVVLFCVFAN